MSIGTSAILTCLSSDSKPTSAYGYAWLIETDTGKLFNWSGSAFVEHPAVSPSNQQRLLFVLRSADFQSTSDQAFTKIGAFTNYMPARILGRRVSGGVTVACAGGIYTGASKGGDALVSAAQSWAGMSGAGKVQDATVASIAITDVHTATPILSLTTGSTGAITGDIYIFGMILD